MHEEPSGHNLKGNDQNKGLRVPLLHIPGPAKGLVLALTWHRADLTAPHSPGDRSVPWQPRGPALWRVCGSAQWPAACPHRLALPAQAGSSRSCGWRSRRPSVGAMPCRKTPSCSDCSRPPAGTWPVAQKILPEDFSQLFLCQNQDWLNSGLWTIPG